MSLTYQGPWKPVTWWFTAKRKIARWWKCRVRRLHFYKFVAKCPDGSRWLKCVRCGKSQYTNPRRAA